MCVLCMCVQKTNVAYLLSATRTQTRCIVRCSVFSLPLNTAYSQACFEGRDTCSRWRSQLQQRRLVSFKVHVPRNTAFSPDTANGAPLGQEERTDAQSAAAQAFISKRVWGRFRRQKGSCVTDLPGTFQIPHSAHFHVANPILVNSLFKVSIVTTV